MLLVTAVMVKYKNFIHRPKYLGAVLQFLMPTLDAVFIYLQVGLVLVFKNAFLNIYFREKTSGDL